MDGSVTLPVAKVTACFLQDRGKRTAVPGVHDGVEHDLDPARSDEEIAIGVAPTSAVGRSSLNALPRLCPAVPAEIRHVTAHRPENGWWVPRHNYIFGKLTLGAGWYPDYQMRLLRGGTARYERPVHEVVVLDGQDGYLENPLIHFNYHTVAQFRAKQARYTDYDAHILLSEGMRPRLYTPLTQAVRHFAWRFFSLRGYRDGLHGLRLCLLTAWYEAIKYRKLAALVRKGHS